MDADRSTRPVLTAQAMREADRFTIDTYGLPGFTLMESAGRAAAAEIAASFAPVDQKRVTVFCGKGNNGGDGLVVARQLFTRGATVRAILMSEDPDALSPDAGHNLRLLKQLAEEDATGRLHIQGFDSMESLSRLPRADVHVDALLGTGLTSELRSPIREVIDWLDAQLTPVVAIDIPTGLQSDTGTVLGAAPACALTITMGALKAGLLLGEGKRLSGRVEVADIGIPPFTLQQAAREKGCALLPTDATVAALLPERTPDAHKYSVGMALVVAGQPGMTGAPVMASTAAARAGAGYVQCASPEPILPALDQKFTEITTLALPTAEDGGLDPEKGMQALSDRLERARALLVGPGLGRKDPTQRFVRELLRTTDLPAVIDADGLSALSDDWLAEEADGRWVLTPHEGEFKRLAGDEVDLTDRIQTAQVFARRWNSVLVLKGMPSIVATPNGPTFLAATGNTGLATAGTGDVLAGFITGFCAQGCSPLEAALCGLHLGGACAERYATSRDPRSLVATDLLHHLPHVMHERFSSLPLSN